MPLADLTREAVLAALREHDDLGRAAFLKQYRFGEARSYFLFHEGKRYDSKAIAGAAHGNLPGHRPLRNEDFSGGDKTVKAKLVDLGFAVEGPAKKGGRSGQASQAGEGVPGRPNEGRVPDDRPAMAPSGTALDGPDLEAARQQLRVAAIGLRADLGEDRGQAAAEAIAACFRGWSGPGLALLPGVSDDYYDGDAWAAAARKAAQKAGVTVLFEATHDDERAYVGHDGRLGQDILAVQQVFATSAEADHDVALVDAVLDRSASGGGGSLRAAGRTVGLLVCGENNVLRNAQAEGNAVSVRHHPGRDLFEHAHVVCNGAHTLMGNWGKLDRRFEYLSRGSRCALYATNTETGAWTTACRAYLDGKRVATGAGIDVQTANVRQVVDPKDRYRAVTLDLGPGPAIALGEVANVEQERDDNGVDDDAPCLTEVADMKHLLNVVPWDVAGHVRTIYRRFRCRNGAIPNLMEVPGDGSVPAFQKCLMDWKADLGARGRIDWNGLFEHYERILAPLCDLPRLGELTDKQVEIVALAVAELENFKPSLGRKLVFGSKAAHFVFPWLVPVISSDVVRGIENMRRLQLDGAEGDFLAAFFGYKRSEGVWVKFGDDPEQNGAAYFEYLLLGNTLLKNFDDRDYMGKFGESLCLDFRIDAKLFEWALVSWDPRLLGHEVPRQRRRSR